MLKTLTKTVLAASTALILGSASAQAASVLYSHLNLDSTGGVTVDGGTLEVNNLSFEGNVSIKMKTGKVGGFAVYMGDCGTLCGYMFKQLYGEILDKNKMEVEKDISFGVPSNALPYGLTQNLEGRHIIDACGERMKGSIVKTDQTFTHLVHVTLGVHYAGYVGDGEFNAYGSGGDIPGGGLPSEYVDWRKAYTVPVQVTCKAPREPVTPNDVVFDHGDFKVKGIELFLSTFASATTEPNPATTCRKGRALVRLKASKAGNAKFKLWTKVGDAAMTSKVIDAWASHDGNGGFKAEHTEWVSVDETSHFQAMAEEMVTTDGVAKSTPWKDITLPCTSKEGGGLTTQHDEPQAPPRTLKGDFSFVDHGAPKCTREGKALISFSSNQSGDVNYTLDCTNGQNFSGTAKLVKNPAGGYVAAAIKTFNIATSTVYSCALKSSAPGAAKLHQWKSHDYKCEIPAVIPPVGGLQVAPKPSTDARDVPAKVDAVVATPDREAEAERQRRAAIQARLKAAQNAAEAQRRREAAIAAERVKAAQAQQRLNALRLQQSLEAAQKRRVNTPAVQAAPQLRIQRPALRRR